MGRGAENRGELSDMKKPYKADADCFAAADKASGGKLHRSEIDAAFQRAADHRETLRARGEVDGLADRLRGFAEREAERAKIAAALARRHTGLNILVRDRQEQALQALMRGGLSPRNALLAMLEGSQRGIEGARVSIAALNNAYEARYLGGVMAELQGQVPHFVDLLKDARMDADIMREMAELKEGGKPGLTGNQDAQKIAKIFASYAELSRGDLNKLGASIGKLEGWSGAQTHDDIKMIAAGKDAWSAAVARELDIERSFPDVESADELADILGDIYDSIVTGVPNRATPRERGQRVNPANMARRLGRSRVLHFRDADAALAYREAFGHGNTVSGMFSHLRRAARMAANMEVLGPNPDVMFGSLVEGMKRRIRDDAKLSAAAKQKQLKGLDADAGVLRQAIDIANGLASRPVDVTPAKIGADIRAVQSMAKLGGAAISSLSDVPIAAIASLFRGSGFFPGLFRQIDGIMEGRPKGEQGEIAFLFGEGFDGIVGNIVSPMAASDSPVGKFSRLQEKFFRWNGLTWWTDVNRATAARVIAAEMGLRAKSAYAELPANYRHVLGLHGIDAAKWDAIRKAEFRQSNGNAYITPDRIRTLDDAAIEPLVADRFNAARKAARNDADYAARRDSIIADGRRDLELSMLRFVADETSYSVVEVDARSQRFMTRGLRPGTLAGEAMRFVGQFKGFPVAFTQRVFGRAVYGHRKDAGAMARGAHIGTLIAGMTMAGYMALTVKDMLRGNWPPRDPFDGKTILAALMQGGAAGLYGDFLFSHVNRFGGGVLETLAGPTIGAAADLVETGLKARDAGIGVLTGADAKLPAADALNLTLDTMPFANLFYVRPALDYLLLNSIREAISPGYLKRQEKRRRTEYGQDIVVPRTAF